MPVHPFDQAETMLGQGTLGMELEQDAPDFDTLLVPVGGGGLIGGIAGWFSGRVRIIAVEPEQAPTLHAALAAGMPIDAPAEGIAGDSLAPPRVGPTDISDREGTCRAGVAGERRCDPSSAGRVVERAARGGRTRSGAAVAPLLSRQYRPAPGERVAVVLTGANTTAVNFDG